jgi:Ca2+-dependent lipid-binding protein
VNQQKTNIIQQTSSSSSIGKKMNYQHHLSTSSREPTLTVYLIKATSLRKYDKLCDAYVQISFSHGDLTYSSRVIEDNKSPEWNEEVSLHVGPYYNSAVMRGEQFFIKLAVYDKENVRDHLLGEVKVYFVFKAMDLETMNCEGKLYENIPLENTLDGKLTFAIKTRSCLM